mgnify:CR=1 FL=1
MRICCLGDLHYYGVRKDLERLVRNVENNCLEADVVVIVGDLTSSGNLGHLEQVLSTVKEVVEPIPILVVPGNHDIYVTADEVSRGINNSLLKLSLFNELVEKLDCIALMKSPYIINDVGFIGSIGWYDYSFAPNYLGLSIDDFREKAYGLHIWADRDYVKLPFSDEEFTLMLLNRFEAQIKEVNNSVERMVAVLHHLPFRELVHYKLQPEWDYFSTFMGSEAFGHVVKKFDKVRLVLHGHQHNGVETMVCREVCGVRCCNCASPVPLVIEDS